MVETLEKKVIDCIYSGGVNGQYLRGSSKPVCKYVVNGETPLCPYASVEEKESICDGQGEYEVYPCTRKVGVN